MGVPPPSWASSVNVRNTMRANRGRDTGPELVIRRILHADGFRYRVNARPLAGFRRTADIVFSRQRIAVFVDGCFWHGCPIHYVSPKSNPEFWSDKLKLNRARDSETTAVLEAAGWQVVRVWEHDDPRQVAEAIEQAVLSQRESGSVNQRD